MIIQILLSIVVLMALACTATPAATPTAAPTPSPNFSKSEILELVKDRSNRRCIYKSPVVVTRDEFRAIPWSKSGGYYYPYSVVRGSFKSEINITYKPSGVWLAIAKVGREEKNEKDTEQTISDSCTFRIDDATGSSIK